MEREQTIRRPAIIRMCPLGSWPDGTMLEFEFIDDDGRHDTERVVLERGPKEKERAWTPLPAWPH